MRFENFFKCVVFPGKVFDRYHSRAFSPQLYMYGLVVQGSPKKKAASSSSSKSSPEKPPAAVTPRNVAAVSKALAAGVPAGS